MEKLVELKNLVLSAEKDAEKFYSSGNKAAGTRVRKAMLEINALTKQIRAEVQEMKNAES
ncbi:MAG: histone H1 [Spirosomataceae bacterium]